MSTTLPGAGELVEVLTEAGIDVYDHVPEVLAPPCVVLEPGIDYLLPADTYGGREVNLDAYVLVDLVGNEAAAEEYAGLLTQVLALVGDAGFVPISIDKPGPQHTAAWLAHGSRISLHTTI